MPTSRRRSRDRLEGRALPLLAHVGLGVVLLALAGLVIGGLVADTDTTKNAERSGDLAEAYLTAQDALSREHKAVDIYKDDPDPELRDDFDRAAADFSAAVTRLEQVGDARDRALALRASELHRRYVSAMGDIFAAGDDGDLVQEINAKRIDPAQNALQPLVNGTGRQYAVAQLKALDELEAGEQRELIVASIAFPLGAILYVLLVTMFVRQRRRLDEIARAEVARLDEAAHTDSLTGLLNHRALQRDVATHDGLTRVMSMIDVVGLKPVNDRQGHLAGDALLQTVAAALREEIAGYGRAYRIGGDEFAIVFPGADESAGWRAIEAIHDRIAVRHAAGVRAGVAVGTNGAHLIARASKSLLDARRGELRIA